MSRVRTHERAISTQPDDLSKYDAVFLPTNERRNYMRVLLKRFILLLVVVTVCWPLISAYAEAEKAELEWSRALLRSFRASRRITKTTIPEQHVHVPVLSKQKSLKRSRIAGNVVPQGQHSQKLFRNRMAGLGTSPGSQSKPRRSTSFLDGDFPPYEDYVSLVRKASMLPDVVHIPFEEAVADVELPPWAFQWISEGIYDAELWGNLTEPKIDFIYTWVNGSSSEFRETRKPYEANSTLNDPEGVWMLKHGENRYRDWDEFRYSIRSVEANAPFRNKYFVLSNAVLDEDTGKLKRSTPSWLNQEPESLENFHVLVQEDYFEEEKKGCIPAFNSLTVENQMFNIESDVDPIFGLSDDMLLGKPFSASDIWSPLFGPMMGFKTNSYNTLKAPTEQDAKRFGEKPWLIYTSWLLNRRFGNRKRKGQAHFGHAITRSVSRETMKSFPGPDLQSACSRFRGDFDFQIYLWYAAFHYTMERHREALLWSYITIRADANGDGKLSWDERQTVIDEIAEGMEKLGPTDSNRIRTFYHASDILEEAGLQSPQVNTDILWTSQDGPVMIQNLECFEFDLNECLAPGFSYEDFGQGHNPVFSTDAMFDRVSRQNVNCGDCLTKLLLNRVERGLEPMLPNNVTHPTEREIVLKALLKYQYSVIDPDALFVMVTDAEQIETAVLNRIVKKNRPVGQLCLNDDVELEDPQQLQDLQDVMTDLYFQMFPYPSPYEVQ